MYALKSSEQSCTKYEHTVSPVSMGYGIFFQAVITSEEPVPVNTYPSAPTRRTDLGPTCPVNWRVESGEWRVERERGGGTRKKKNPVK